MSWSTLSRAVTLQLLLAMAVVGVELARGPLPALSGRVGAAAPPLPPAPAAPVLEPVIPAAFPSPAGGGPLADEAVREILALRREHGGLLNAALWQVPEGTDDASDPADDAGWEEAEFSRALQRVMRADATP